MKDIKKDIRVALDVSTKTIGCALVWNDGSEYGKILELTHVSPSIPKKECDDKTRVLFLKVEIFRNEFLKKYKNLEISNVYIEEPLVTSNNSETCSTLLRFNGMISLAVFEEWGVVPQYISSYDARKYSFPDLMGIRKFNKNGEPYDGKKILSSLKKSNFVLFGNYPWDVDKKLIMQEKVSELFPDIKWVYNKKGELAKENFDATDAYVALLGSLNKERYGELDMTASNVRVNEGRAEYTLRYWDKVEDDKILYL